jgi:hypothetical protein
VLQQNKKGAFMTYEQNKEDIRRKSLRQLWHVRHPGQSISPATERHLEALIKIGREYDAIFTELKDRYALLSREKILYLRSKRLREKLGIKGEYYQEE